MNGNSIEERYHLNKCSDVSTSENRESQHRLPRGVSRGSGQGSGAAEPSPEPSISHYIFPGQRMAFTPAQVFIAAILRALDFFCVLIHERLGIRRGHRTLP